MNQDSHTEYSGDKSTESTSDAFDLQWSKRKRRLEQNLTDPFLLDEKLHELRKQNTFMQASKIDQADLGTGPGFARQQALADQPYFPGNYVFEFKRFAFSDPDLQGRFEDIINTHPSMLMDVEIPDFVHSDTQDLSHDERRAAQRTYTREVLLPYLKIIIGFNIPNPGIDVLDTIYEEMFNAKSVLIESVHDLQLLHEAAELITALAPNLQQAIDEVLPLIIQVKPAKAPPAEQQPPVSGVVRKYTSKAVGLDTPTPSANPNMMDMPELKNVGIGERKGAYLYYIPQISVQEISENHALYVLASAHELMHAVTQHVLFGESQRVTSQTNLEEREQIKQGNKGLELYRVILEGVSLALEHDILEHVKDPESATIFKAWARQRVRHIQDGKRILNPQNAIDRVQKKRQEGMGNAFAVLELLALLDTANHPWSSYSEGARMAMALQKNGWTLNQFPNLANKIQSVISTELGVERTSSEQAQKIAGRSTKFREFFFDTFDEVIYQLSEVSAIKLKRLLTQVQTLATKDPSFSIRQSTIDKLKQHVAELGKSGTRYTRILTRINELKPDTE